ncbi:MAG: divergent polysaccharide deacetylase family protein [Candidatus Omnitrophica bacterium]|nr:divergent polysaccharide deacetylase family protein [Candidatus Omnitrophota bacterium]
MDRKQIVAASLIIIALAAGLFYWHSVQRARIDKSAALKRALTPVFLKAGLTDDKLIKKTVEENILNGKRYISSFVEYNVPRSFSWSGFESALRSALKKTPFRIFDIDRIYTRDLQSYIVVLHYGRYDVMTIRINRKGRAEEPAVPVVKAHKRPRVAIVMDDFGYNLKDLDTLFSMKQAVTISILPGQRYSMDIARMAKEREFETILHLPLEPHPAKDVIEEADTIRCGMSEQEVVLRLKKAIAAVPGIDGVNNHMGSKATEDTKLMTVILKYLKSQDLYFLDSLTSKKSVCGKVSRSLGMWCGRRDIFLDNSNTTAAIEKQLSDMKNLAFRRGTVIAICHDRKNTIAVLSKILPEMEEEGIKFVKLSELAKT